MRTLFMILFVGCMAGGCASAREPQTRVQDLERTLDAQDAQILELTQAIERKNNDIAALQGLLAERDRQLAEKEEQTNQLRKRLEGFGVFE